MYNMDNLQAHARGKWLEIIKSLAPELSKACDRVGKHVRCCCHGKTDGFRMYPDAAETGGGYCNLNGGFKGGISLLMWKNGWDFKKTVEAISSHLGLTDGAIPIIKPIQKPESQPEKDWGSKQRWIKVLWDEATPNHPRLKQYLEYRGLSLDPPPSLRLHEGLKYLDDQKRNLGTFPCMIAQFIRGHDLVGMHVTFLDRDNPGKADVEHEKKIWKCANTVNGGSIHLFDSQPNKPLALVEGIESGLSVMELSNFPVWVCGNAGLMERVEIPESVHSIYIGGDKDRSGQGKKSTTNLATRLCNKGVKVKTSFPPIEIPDGASSVDWNDYVAMGREVVHG